MKLRVLPLCALVAAASFAFAQRASTGATRTIEPIGQMTSAPRVVDLRLRPRGLGSGSGAMRGDAPPPSVGVASSFGLSSYVFNATIAVGPQWVFACADRDFVIYSKFGEFETLGRLVDIYGVNVGYYFSFRYGRAFYDADANRYVVIFLGQAGDGDELFYAVSDDDDPHGLWTSYSFLVEDIPLDGREWSFLAPSHGIGEEGFVSSGNLRFNTTTLYNGTYMVVVPKDDLYTGGPVTASIIHDPTTLDVHFGKSYGSSPGPVFGAARVDDDTTRFVAVTDAGGSPALHLLDMDVAPAGPINTHAESTNGGFLVTWGQRVTSVVRAFDRLYLGYNSPNGDYSASYWAEYDTGQWPTSGVPIELQTGVSADSEANQFLPAIGVNRHRDMTLLVLRSSVTITHDAAAVGRMESDPVGWMSSHVVLSSTVQQQGTNQVTGRYLDIALDPSDGETFWGTYGQLHPGEFGNELWIASWWVSKTHSEAPWSYNWIIGTPKSGTLNSFNWDDDDFFVVRAGNPVSSSAPAAQVVVDAVAPGSDVLSFGLELRAKVNTPGLAQRIELWDWAAGDYVDMGSLPSSVVEGLHTVTAGGDPARFVKAGTREVRARLSWSRIGPVLVWPWTVSVDQVRWRVRARG